ncbi:unnamed protein product [Vitrella brassicaformis CCMP3155]|uniref:SAM domain-containing protein n=2 Tax=Vitrella brassicaformis TaxID=1169539 RepID=A0A0G4EE86_VITBC|nr:unnamed protein product [Vitrella brassicaformis CCMP3155]|eukprot:CEL94292.1 unnamed protein product [Vitrella brassicaformis CCMP3155]
MADGFDGENEPDQQQDEEADEEQDENLPLEEGDAVRAPDDTYEEQLIAQPKRRNAPSGASRDWQFRGAYHVRPPDPERFKDLQRREEIAQQARPVPAADQFNFVEALLGVGEKPTSAADAVRQSALSHLQQKGRTPRQVRQEKARKAAEEKKRKKEIDKEEQAKHMEEWRAAKRKRREAAAKVKQEVCMAWGGGGGGGDTSSAADAHTDHCKKHDEDTVDVWLSGHGLSVYAQRLRDSGYDDMQTFALMGRQDVDQMLDIVNCLPGHRIKVSNAIRQLQQHPATTHPLPPPQHTEDRQHHHEDQHQPPSAAAAAAASADTHRDEGDSEPEALGEEGDMALALRLPSGKTVRGKFDKSTKLRAIFTFARRHDASCRAASHLALRFFPVDGGGMTRLSTNTEDYLTAKRDSPIDELGLGGGVMIHVELAD